MAYYWDEVLIINQTLNDRGHKFHFTTCFFGLPQVTAVTFGVFLETDSKMELEVEKSYWSSKTYERKREKVAFSHLPKVLFGQFPLKSNLK